MSVPLDCPRKYIHDFCRFKEIESDKSKIILYYRPFESPE